MNGAIDVRKDGGKELVEPRWTVLLLEDRLDDRGLELCMRPRRYRWKRSERFDVRSDGTLKS